MTTAKVKVITIITSKNTRYGLSYGISSECDSDITRTLLSLCEHAIMKGYCDYFGLNVALDKHWIPINKNASVIFDGCPIGVVRDVAEIIRCVIDAEKVEEVIIDERIRKRAYY